MIRNDCDLFSKLGPQTQGYVLDECAAYPKADEDYSAVATESFDGTRASFETACKRVCENSGAVAAWRVLELLSTTQHLFDELCVDQVASVVIMRLGTPMVRVCREPPLAGTPRCLVIELNGLRARAARIQLQAASRDQTDKTTMWFGGCMLTVLLLCGVLACRRS